MPKSVKKKSVVRKRRKLQEAEATTDIPKKNEDSKSIIIIKNPVGSPGTEIYSGHFYEEYLRDLQGYKRADEFDKMRRSDASIKMCLSAVKNPIRSAVWEWDKGKDGNEEHADFLSFIFFESLCDGGWSKLLNEASTICDFGHSIFEKVHSLVLDHKKWGNFIGLEGLYWRSPRTIETWNLDKSRGRLLSVKQLAQGDLSRSMVVMPREALVLMNLDQEGANYEGISLLRPCYGAWKRKDLNLKLMGIGNEKFAVPTPDVEVPANKENTVEYQNMIQALENYTSHETAYLIHPQGWNMKLNPSPFDPEKVIKSIEFENREMAFAFLANFLLLGAGGGSGSFALSNDLSDFFLGGIDYVVRNMCEPLNELGKELIILNYGKQETYPKLKASGIADKIGQEFGTLLKSLYDGKFITPADADEIHLRKRIGLPEMSDEGRRDFNNGSVVPGGADPNKGNPGKGKTPDGADEIDDDSSEEDELDAGNESPKNNKEFTSFGERHQFARKGIVRDIKSGSGELLEIIQRNLAEQTDSIVDQLKGERNPTATKNVKRKNQKRYEQELTQSLVKIANSAIDGAKKEIGTKKDIRLVQEEITFKFAKKKLPKKLMDRIKSQAVNISENTLSQLEGTVFMAFGDSLVSTKDDDIVEKDMREAADKVIDGPGVQTSSVNATARVVNESRVDLFSAPEIIQDIESFTFYNPDPSSEICQDLNGKTFAANDPEAKRYYPPLHHNCKSTLYPNLKGKKNNPEISQEGLKPSDPSLDKYISLDDHVCGKKFS